MKKIILVLLMINFSTFSQDSSSKNTSIKSISMPFLLITPDAKAGGMGDIGVATRSDAFSIHNNISKMAFNEKTVSMGINYTPWMRNLIDDIFVGGISYINHFKENEAWGIDVKYFSLGEIQTNNGTTNTGAENPSELAITGAYSLKLSERFSMGVGFKYINSNYKINSANTNLNAVNTLAVDLSGYYMSEEENYKNFNGRYRLGFNIANIGPKVAYTYGVENFIPTNIRVGGAFDFIFKKDNLLSLNLELGKLLVPSDQESDKGWFEGMFTSLGDRNFKEEMKEVTWAFGAEYTFSESFSIKSGYFHENQTKGNRQYFTLGTGFRTKDLDFDLSYLINNSGLSNPIGNTFRISISYNIGETLEIY